MVATRRMLRKSRGPGAATGAADAANIASPIRIPRIVPPRRRTRRVLFPRIRRSDDEEDLPFRALLRHAVCLAHLRDRQALADGNAQLATRSSQRQLVQ